MSKKSRRKSPGQPALFTKGGPQGPGRGPAKGTGGRPRNEFRQRCRELCSDDEILEYFDRVLRQVSPAKPELALRIAELKLRVWERLADRGYGKATQPVTVGPEDSRELEDVRKLSDDDLVSTFKELRRKASARN